MAKSYGEQFDQAMAVTNQAEANQWLNDEIRRYIVELGTDPAEARRTILTNLGYMAGYYGPDEAKKVQDLYGAAHPIFGTDYHGKVSAEDAMAAGKQMAKR